MTTKLYFIHALSPIHCGTGHAIGGIDLPIAREKPTGLPLVPGSTVKGVLRALSKDSALTVAVFGPDTENASDHAGQVQFSDARLLFLPVRSVRGTFAWVTSPTMLRRFARDAKEVGLELELPKAPANDGVCLVSDKETLVAGTKVVLEDFDFDAKESNELRNLADEVARRLFGDDTAARASFDDRVALVSDDVMSVLQHTAMEVIARNRIDPEKGTVAKGALWTEEALPVESILVGLLAATPLAVEKTASAGELLGHVTSLTHGKTIQVGGGATIGRGLCRLEVV